MANPGLTAGALARIVNDEKLDGPVVQVTACKRIDAASSAGERYKLQLSDGQSFYSSCMLATQLNERVIGGELQPFSIIRVTKYLLNTLSKHKKVIVLVDFTQLKSGDKVGVKLGNPQPVEDNPSAPLAPINAAPPAPKMAAASANSNAPPPSMDPNMPTANVFPIQSITPYQNKWTIRARVTSKGAIKTYNNSRGEGKLFSVDLADESGEIRATCFNKEVDRFHALLEPNGVYYISRGQIKAANKKFSSINNDYELTFNAETQISPCHDDSNFKIPTVNFNFVKINMIPTMPKDKMIDVLGIVKSCGDVQTITSSKFGKEFQKRDLQLVDDSCSQITLTLWSQQAVDFSGDGNPVVAIKGAKIGDYNGVNLGTTQNSSVQICPDIKEAHALRGWYDSQGCAATIVPLSGQGGGGGGDKTWNLIQLALIGAGHKEKGDYFTVKGTVMAFRKEQALYMGCSNGDCKKKVIDMSNGTYRCEKCNKEMSSFKYRLMLQMCISDISDHLWVSCFEDTAAVVLGMDAQALGMLKEREPEAFDKAFADATFKQFTFRIRTKMETFNDESRLKHSVISVAPLEFVEYEKYLASQIAKMELDDLS